MLSHVLRQLSLPTPWPRERRAAWWFLTVALLGLVFLSLPRAVGWRGDHLHSEDGQVFLTGFLADGWGSIAHTYAGYLHAVPRLVTAACATVVGPDGYAACVAVSANTVRVSTLLVAFPVLAAYARSWKWGLAAATMGIVLVPAGQQEVLANLTNLRWFLLAAAFFAVIGLFRQTWLIAVASVFAALSALSEPMTLLLVPIAVWRVISVPRWSKAPSIALIASGVIHLLAVDPGARGERGGVLDLLGSPTQTIGQLLVRGPVTTQWGVTLTQDIARTWGFPVAIATIGLSVAVLILAWRGRRIDDPAVPFAVLSVTLGMSFLLVTLAFPASYISLADFWSPSQPARYSTLTGLFLTPSLILAMSRAWSSRRDPLAGRVAVVLLGAALAAAVIGDAGGDARSTDGPTWRETLVSARDECAAGAEAVQVPNSAVFEGWTTTLTCPWLGVG